MAKAPAIVPCTEDGTTKRLKELNSANAFINNRERRSLNMGATHSKIRRKHSALERVDRVTTLDVRSHPVKEPSTSFRAILLNPLRNIPPAKSLIRRTRRVPGPVIKQLTRLPLTPTPSQPRQDNSGSNDLKSYLRPIFNRNPLIHEKNILIP